MKILLLLGQVIFWNFLLASSAFAENRPQYYVSPLYYLAGAPMFRDVSENRTLTALVFERDWTMAGGPQTGNIVKQRSTGAFTSPPLASVTESKVPMLSGYSKVYNAGFKGYRMPVTEAGDVLMYVGNTTPNGSVIDGGGGIWKADNSVVRFTMPNSAVQLIPRDMNQKLESVGTALYEYVDQFGRDRTRPMPYMISPAGTATRIPPSRVERYGFETVPDKDDPIHNRPDVVLDNGARGVAINNQGAVVCDAYGLILHENTQKWQKQEWSFVASSVGFTLVEDLPEGATDINDLGEVVGYNRFEGTWLYLPNGNYGMEAGVHVIDPLIYTDGFDTSGLEVQPLINNRGDVVWRGTKFATTGSPVYPPKLWRAGQAYYLTLLFETDEDFDILDVQELNEKGDILVNTVDKCEYSNGSVNSCWGNRILSLAPFDTELIVNVTDDVSDADPDDAVIDTDLEKSGLQISLRAAIDAVNAGEGSNIKFELPGDEVPVLILTKALPVITEPVEIDGTTESSGKVEIRGGAHSGAGFHLQGGESVVRGMVMRGFTGQDAAAIRISGPGGNKIMGNWLGTDAAGNKVEKTQFGVLIEGSPDNQIGGDGADESNILYGETAGIRIIGAGANDNQVLGNRIGIGVDGTIFTPLAGVGVHLAQGDNTIVGGPGNAANLIAGDSGIIVSGDSAMSGIEITGNRIGLTGAGDRSSGGFLGIGLIGSELGPVSDIKITGNKIAGHRVNVLLLGTINALRDVDILDNEIGLRFDGSTSLPAGLSNGVHEYGVRIEGATDVELSDNVIAGHTWNVLLSGIAQIFITGGDDTDGDGVKDANFNIEFRNPSNPVEVFEDETPSSGATVARNFIGLMRDGTIPNGFVQMNGLANYGWARATRITDNIIGGHTENGLWLQSGLELVAAGNRIGVTISGSLVPNGQGVTVDAAEVAMTDNIIAHNASVGIKANGETSAVSILGGSIYENGNGLGEAGILYDSKPFPAPRQVIALRTVSDTSGKVTVAFAVPTVGKYEDDTEEGDAPNLMEEPQTTLEIWGNRDASETQGRTLVVSEVIDPGKPFAKKLEVESDSFIATAQNFTATLTRGIQTSGFSTASQAENIVWPELSFAPDAEPGEITFQWPVAAGAGVFVVEESPTLEGPWHKRAVDPVRNGENLEVTLPVGDGDQFFRLVLDPDAALKE